MERIAKAHSRNVQKGGKAKYLTLPLIIWLVAFVIIPLVLVAYYAFFDVTADGKLIFSFANFAKFADKKFNCLEIILKSLKIATISTTVCLIIGYPVAYIMSRSSSKMRTVIIMLILLPMWMNFMLRTRAWLILLDDNNGIISNFLSGFGIKNIKLLGEGAVILGTIYDFLPFMIMSIYMVLIKLDNSLLEAAYDLGATPFQRFMKIVVPFSIPGVLSGITMVFVPSVTTFAISKYLGNGKVTLIGDLIERQFNKANDWGFGAAISLIVMIIVMLSMFAINKIDSAEDLGERRMIM